MKLDIYSKDGQHKLTVAPESNNAESLGIQEESTLALSFIGFACVPLEVYDYAEFQGRRYWVTERYVPKMNARKEWAYSVSLFGVEGLAAQTLMVNPSDDDNPVLTLTAPAREHAALIVANLNRRMGTTDWKVGEVVVSEYIDIEYTGKYASDALSELSEAAGTEWWFDGMTLNISRCEFGEAIPLSYGNGLLGGISRTTADGVKFFTRLFPVGSSRNIDPDYYGHARLQLPDGAKYVEQDIQLGIIEHYEQAAFEGIYPRRVGQVGTVRHEEATGDDGEPFTIWYFTDPDIPFDPNQYEIGGLVKRVTFQSGELRGREFEVNYDAGKKEFEIITQWPYDDDLQLPSEPLIPAPGDEYILWNIRMPENYYPAAEQEFKESVDRFMADNRKDVSVWQAPTDFTVIERRGLDLRPGQRVRLESADAFPDTGFRETRIVSISRSVVRPGSMTLKMSDVLSTGRISRIESNIASVERLTKQVSSEFPDLIRSWEETPASDTTLYTSRKSEREFLNKRRGGTVQENVTFDKNVTVGGAVVSKDFRPGDFSGSGYAGYIDANGNAVLEADIIKARKEAVFNTAVINQVTFKVGATVFSNGGCEIVRVEELDDVYRCYYDTKEGRRLCGLVVGDQVRCQHYDASQNTIIKYYWRLVMAVGDDYVDLSKTDADGSGIPKAGDEIAQFGHRTDKTRQGATIIDPKDGSSVVVYSEINSYSLSKKNFVGLGTNPQTGRPYLYCYGDFFLGDRELKDQFLTFQIPDGQTVPQLFARMNITLGAGSSGLTNLTEWADKQQQINEAQDTANEALTAANEAAQKAQDAKDYIDNTLPDEIAEINKKLDGVVENWFYPYTPTLSNEPAATWISDGEQANHEGDTFTNTQSYVDDETTPDAGKSWRWVKDGSSWKWTPIADSDAVKALLQAAQAQDTADNKRRIFVVEPTPPYDVGDMWAQGEGGDILRCIKSRQTGAFDATDWDLASKYTDDTVANEVKGWLNTWASDGVVSPPEKSGLEQIYQSILYEKDTILARAGKYNISTQAYEQAFDLAETALLKYTSTEEETIPIEDDYQDIYDYYSVKENLLRQINNAEATAISDLNYLKGVFPNNVVDNNGVFLSQLMAVKNSTSADAVVVAGLYGGGVESLNNAGFKDSEHGTLMMFAGADNIQSVASAKTRIYGDGSLFTNQLFADGGKIGGFTIGDIWLENTYEDDSTKSSTYLSGASIQLKNTKGDDIVDFAVIAYPLSFGGDVFPVTSISNHYNGSNADRSTVALQLSATGSDAGSAGIFGDEPKGSFAIYALNGMFGGLRPMTRKITKSTTLTDMDYTIIAFGNGSPEIVLTLPANPQNGQRYEIIKDGSKQLTINSNGGKILRINSNYIYRSYTYSYTTAHIILIYSYEADNWYMDVVEYK